jgi:SAM-dependent methyltransferase
MAYHRVFLRRYTHTLNLLAEVKQRGSLADDARVIELGSAPYGMSAMLWHYLFPKLTLTGYGKSGTPARERQFVVADVAVTLPEIEFNTEVDRWPFADASLDLVICCEMIEHLAFDPAHIFTEANRVLRLGGWFLVSTPNAVSFQNIVRLVAGATPGLAPHYRLPVSMASLYARHNRELTPRALAAMYPSAGFALEVEETADLYAFDPSGLSKECLAGLRALVGEPRSRGDTITFIGRRIGPVVRRWPTEEMLYLAADVTALDASTSVVEQCTLEAEAVHSASSTISAAEQRALHAEATLCPISVFACKASAFAAEQRALQAEAALSACKASTSAAEQRALEAETATSAAERRALEAEAALSACKGSTSWRITSPLRALATALRR